ncbi:MAG TPA: right-handed parallel beta-helix repeat-containing protein [Parapedobacter sp.]|uniref:right-handed parallel beta-helix repeat-containing protein n=1 Tax=Parapedobacter sp. TaxID=1958893 RepID=UPI002B9AA58D|nr:right-handed parallel beta-helix repeat-containing protein [Parapedobacter sp.]HWK57550.1 right-handed parallel beta-helix repeat-containing protein [Parapedobacter sp.]
MVKIHMSMLGLALALSGPHISNANSITANRIDVTAYGAYPDDGQNDATALRKAMAAARSQPGATVYFPPGVYRFSDDEARRIEYEAISGQYGEDVQGRLFKPDAPYVIALDLAGSRGVTVEAAGATLVLEGWYEAVSITDAENLRINGLTLTYKRPPHTVGVIGAVTDSYFDMQVDTGRYAMLDSTVTGRIHFYDVSKVRVYTGAWHDKKEWLNDTTIRVFSGAKPQPGDLCIFRHSAHYRAGILIKESKNITLADVTIHSQPGMGVVGHRSEDIFLRNLQVIPEPGGVVSTNTDATHFTSCKGRIVLDACKFGGQGDDCTNIHNYYYTLYPDATRNGWVDIAVEQADLHALSLDFPDVGDTLSLVDRESLKPATTYTVRGVDTSRGEWRVSVQLDRPFSGDAASHYLTNETRRPAVEITNNTVRSHLARAYLIKTNRVRIAGNTIQQSSGTAIQLGAESGWRESGPVTDVVIENNWIVDCGYGHGRQTGTAVNIDVSGIDGPPPPLNKNIIIRNNTIQATGGQAIYVSGTDGASVSYNAISGSDRAVLVEHSANVTVQGNGSLPVIINDNKQQ